MQSFVLNTKFPEAAASRVCIQRLGKQLIARGHRVVFNDWNHYDQYDVVLFMSYDPEVEAARKQNPKIIIGIGDPKPQQIDTTARDADFLLVSSLEQRDLFLRANANPFIFPMFPEIPRIEKTHRQNEILRIGYHGNKAHLHSISPHITSALEELGKHRKVEFWAMYNIEKLGSWKFGLPDPKLVTVKHIQWHPNHYEKYLSQVDIGIIPNTILGSYYEKKKKTSKMFKYFFGTSQEDYLTRFKFSSNSGRLYVFSQLGIPVVSDFFPTAAQFLEHGNRGFLAHSAEGWYSCLLKLAESADLRQKLAANLRAYIDENADFDKTTEELTTLLAQLKPKEQVPVQITDMNSWARVFGYLSLLFEYSIHGNALTRAIFLKSKLLLKRKSLETPIESL